MVGVLLSQSNSDATAVVFSNRLKWKEKQVNINRRLLDAPLHGMPITSMNVNQRRAKGLFVPAGVGRLAHLRRALAPILLSIVAACGSDSGDQQQALSWTIDLGACAHCDPVVELAAVRGTLKEQTSCVLFESNSGTPAPLSQQIALREGDVLSLIARASCKHTSSTGLTDECTTIGSVCAKDLGIEKYELTIESLGTVQQALCEKPSDPGLTSQCCELAMSCLKNPANQECFKVLQDCAPSFGFSSGVPIEDIGVLSTIYQRVCVEKTSPLDPSTQCCQLAGQCLNPDVKETCSACYGTTSSEVVFGAEISLVLLENALCGDEGGALPYGDLPKCED